MFWKTSGNETPNVVNPLDQASLSAGYNRNSTLLRYAPENRSSLREVTGKWLL